MLDRLTIERLESASSGGPIVVGLSGGGDSRALLHLLQQSFSASRLHAVIIDHALRPGSEADAAAARASAEAAGVAATIVRLSWPQGPNRAQEAARAARYEALCNTARALNARVIAVGHTRDDQAETVLLRAQRGSGWRGLAGMAPIAPAPIWPAGRGIWLARPLLTHRRAALRDLLREHGVAWIEDPANANFDFARVRGRAALASLEHAGLDPMRFARLAERLRAHADAIDDEALAVVAATVRYEGDAIRIDRSQWRGSMAEQERALAALIAAAGGADRMPPQDGLAGLIATERAATLAGALIRPSRDALRLSRDPGALKGRADGAAPPSPLPLQPEIEAVWDNRLALQVAEPGWSVVTQNGTPVLCRGEERLELPHVRHFWLLRERVEHLLGRINDTKIV